MNAPATIPLSVVSAMSTGQSSSATASIAIGDKKLVQTAPIGQPSFWFVVLDRTNLAVAYNALQQAPDKAPPVGPWNDTNHILIVATLAIGLNHQPQGELFDFLDLNGGGRALRRIEQLAVQFGCGSLGTYGYSLVGVLGNQNLPGFEASQVAGTPTGPILTIQLMPIQTPSGVIYTPVDLNNA